MKMSSKYYDILYKRYEAWSESHPNCIPFTRFPRFSEHLTLSNGKYYLITANSGVGKSRFVKDLFVHNALEFGNHSDIDLDITYFSLEEDVNRFYLLEICRQLYVKYGLSVTMKELTSSGIRRIDKNVLSYVKEIEKSVFPILEKHLTVIDTRDEIKIQKYIDNKIASRGKIITKRVNGIEVFDRYETNPNNYTIFVIDHLKLLNGAGRKKEIMDRFSSEIAVQYRNRYNCIFVVVQQQNAASEQKQFTNRGVLVDNMEPSLDSLGEHKLTQQDADVVLGLYNPERYKLVEHLGYNLERLKRRYRSVRILKNRDGADNLSLGMHFEGAAGIFTELPHPSNELINNFYE